jgi:competence protein ComEC
MRLFAAGCVAGTVALQRAAELPDLSFLCLAVAASLAAWLARRHRAAHAVLLVAAGLSLGFGYAGWRAEVRLAETLPTALEGATSSSPGVVAGFRKRASRARASSSTSRRPRATACRGASRWRGIAIERAPPALAAGDRWTFTARLKRPRGLANLHGFDFEAWALERGIRATGYVRGRESQALGRPRGRLALLAAPLARRDP